jgi:hypothetical protein
LSSKTSVKKPAPKPRKPVQAPPRPARTEPLKKERMSGLDATAKILAKAGEPMRCGDVATLIIDQGLWSTKGKTPAATLNAAIIREIKSKGKESRFRKAGRGLFAAAGKGD